MKKTFLSLSAVFVMALMLVSCNGNAPKGVADKWLNSFYHMDYDNAKKVSTDDTKKMLDMFAQFKPMMADSSIQNMKKVKIEVKDEKIDGDKATVMYVTSENPKPQALHLVKQSGKWMVQFTKQDQMNDATGGSDSTSAPAPTDASAPPAASPATSNDSASMAK